MTKRAHITSRPEYQVGDSVLGLCGKEFTVEVLWDDLPKDKPICRKCVDTALLALTEADQVIEASRLQLVLTQGRISLLDRVLNPEEQMYLDNFAEDDEAHRAELAAQAEKEEQDAEIPVLLHCICEWTAQGTVQTNPECPVHGAPIAPPSEGEDA